MQKFSIAIDLIFFFGYNSIEKTLRKMQLFSIGVIELEIKRDYYLNKLIAKKHNGLI